MTTGGWASIVYRDAQVLVPTSFDVTALPGGVTQVQMFTASAPASGGSCLGPNTGTVTCLLPMRQVPPAYAGEKPTIIDGAPVYLGRNGQYYAPSLGVELTVSGSLARRIVDTLSRRWTPVCTHPPSSYWCGMGIFGLGEPGGVHGQVDQAQGRPLAFQTFDRGLTAMAGAVVDDPEHPPG